MQLTEKAEKGFVDNDKGIAIAEGNGVKEIWLTKCKARDFQKK